SPALRRSAAQYSPQAPTGHAQRHHPARHGGPKRRRQHERGSYGEIEYSYGGRSDKSRSTSHREILPLIYALAGRPPPTPVAGEEYPGYPLLANASPTLAWFLGGPPLLILIAWWVSRPPPQTAPQLIEDGGQP